MNEFRNNITDFLNTIVKTIYHFKQYLHIIHNDEKKYIIIIIHHTLMI